MANITFIGDVDLGLSFEQIAEIPEDVVKEMVMAGAAITVEAQKAKLKELNIYDSNARAKQHLIDSVTAFYKQGRGGNDGPGRYAVVYPAGKRGVRKRKKITKVYKRSKSGRTYTFGGDIVDVTQAEVAFIHEYGAPRRGIPAKAWMQQANEGCANKVVEAELKVYDEFLRSKNL